MFESVQHFAWVTVMCLLMVLGLLAVVLGALELGLKIIHVICKRLAVYEAVVVFFWRYHADKQAKKGGAT